MMVMLGLLFHSGKFITRQRESPIMNPFTKFLNQWSSNRQLDQFVARWDELEMVVVQLYREKMTLADARPFFAETWPDLRALYPRWAAELRPFWQQTKAAGEPTRQDPFQMLIDLDRPEAIVGNWSAMQHLPAAREALNQFILHQGR